MLAVGERGANRNPFNPLEMESHVKNLLKRLMQEEAGQDVIEYALLAAGIAIVLIPTIPALGAALKVKYEAITTKVSTITT